MPTLRVPLIVKLSASGLLLLFVLLKIDIPSLLSVLSRGNISLLVVALLVSVGAYLLNTYKWQLLLRSYRATANYWQLLYLNFIGMFYNLVLPGQVGGEVVKSIQLTRAGVGATDAAVSVVVDRVTGLFALLVLGILGVVISPSAGKVGPQLLPWLAGLAVLLFVATLVLVTGRGVTAARAMGKALHLPSNRLSLKLSEFARRFSTRTSSASALGLPLALSGVFQLCIVFMNFLICLALDIPVTFTQLLWVVAVVSLLQSLPISVAGIGVREGAYVYLLQLQGVAAPAALALSLTVFAIQVLMASVGGLLQLQSLLKRKSVSLALPVHADGEVTSHEPC